MAAKADHLCVLVHGLWGNPEHLKFLSSSLREQHAEDKLHILVVKRNSGSFTYDGIETGGERVANEVEGTLEGLSQAGHQIKKISIIGYSLGGLIARYAIGLLYHKGVFKHIKPVNFTTFATPHLGVRTPLKGYHNHIWNVLGARTLSVSGRQLFMIDSFRDTDRPLLAVLADPDSIFVKGIAQFQHRSVYANVVNDRTVTFFTAAFSQTDPYVRPDDIKINYLKGWNNVILDPKNPVSEKEPEGLPSFHQRITTGTRSFFQSLPIFAFLLVLIPIGSSLFILNSAIQSVRSSRRIRLHEEGKAGIDIGGYRIPLLLNSARHEVEDMFENVNNAQAQEYLDAGSEELASPTQASFQATRAPSFTKHSQSTDSDDESEPDEKPAVKPVFPTLALTQHQFQMVRNLDNVGFVKYPVYIHNHRHTHAAIIRRMDKTGFEEGFTVVKHWLSHFEL